jgi:hypothetical protein
MTVNLKKTTKKIGTRICKLCNSKFTGNQFQRYCKKCKLEKTKISKKGKNPTFSKSHNIVLNKDKLNRIVKNKHRTLNIRCHARNKNNVRCSNTFQITIDKRTKDYPKYCEYHRNEYKRSLFMKEIEID